MNPPPVHFGLGPSPRPEYLYVSTDHNPLGWHGWNHAKQEPVVIEHPAVTGYVRKVERVDKEYRGESNPKLCIHVAAPPRNYVVQSGLTTHFSRGVLAALARLAPAHYEHPLTIEVQPGDEGKVVFGNVYNAANGGQIRGSDADREADPEHLLARVQAALVEHGGR